MDYDFLTFYPYMCSLGSNIKMQQRKKISDYEHWLRWLTYCTLKCFSNQQKLTWLWKIVWCIIYQIGKNKQFLGEKPRLSENEFDKYEQMLEADLNSGSVVNKSDTLTTIQWWYSIKLLNTCTNNFTKHLL